MNCQQRKEGRRWWFALSGECQLPVSPRDMHAIVTAEQLLKAAEKHKIVLSVKLFRMEVGGTYCCRTALQLQSVWRDRRQRLRRMEPSIPRAFTIQSSTPKRIQLPIYENHSNVRAPPVLTMPTSKRSTMLMLSYPKTASSIAIVRLHHVIVISCKLLSPTSHSSLLTSA